MFKFLKLLGYFSIGMAIVVTTVFFYIDWQMKRRGFESIEELNLSGQLYFRSSDRILRINFSDKEYDVIYRNLPIFLQWTGMIDANTFLYSEGLKKKNIIKLSVETDETEIVGTGFPFTFLDGFLVSIKQNNNNADIVAKNMETQDEFSVVQIPKENIPSFQNEHQFLSPIQFEKNSIIFMGTDSKMWVYSLREKNIIKTIPSKNLAPIFIRSDGKNIFCRDLQAEKYVWYNLDDNKTYKATVPGDADLPIYSPKLDGIFYTARSFFEKRDLYYMNLDIKKTFTVYRNTGYINGFFVE